ncbi:hypothetical protein [Burkholderia gladioli]|uniref:hypothetical protein n=1 Tax=Burkholderia gladioli TaxID=28095 RepID=UPI0016404DE6|nr:hypothetical protein [Burkholderia gladioli]
MALHVRFSVRPWERRKERAKRMRAEARAALRRNAIAFRCSVSASAASLAVTIGGVATLAVADQASTALLTFAVIESGLAVVSIVASVYLNQQSYERAADLRSAEAYLAEMRARLKEMERKSLYETAD